MTDIVNGVLLHDQHVLMALRSPSRSNYPGTWSFPGGHVEGGETLEQALRRELSEEIGILTKSWSFIQRLTVPTNKPDEPVTFHFFVVEQWQGEPQNIGDEHTEIRWAKLHDAIEMRDLTFSSYVELFQALVTVTDVNNNR